MQDLGNDVLYPFFLDVGRPVVSYVEDLAALPMYPLAKINSVAPGQGTNRCLKGGQWHRILPWPGAAKVCSTV